MPPRPRYNQQLFARRHPPPECIEVGGGRYRLVRVFKHDFFAATCLYQAEGPAELSRVVVKFGRDQTFCGLPMAWYGRMLRRHEETVYRRLRGVVGVPRWAGAISETAYAIEYVDARPLDHLERPPAGLFDRLRGMFDEIHACGVAYCDANKRSNILVADDGRCWLIDYQVSIWTHPRWLWPLRALAAAVVRYFQRGDLYHLYKHKRRLAPQELRSEEDALSRRRGALHSLHRAMTDPWRRMRRRFLQRQYSAGRLVSPTENLEDHDQPEKATWRKTS